MFDIALIEKPEDEGLTAEEIEDLTKKIGSDMLTPIEFLGRQVTSSAMGFISVKAAEKIDYKTYNNSPLAEFIASILDDMDNENENGEYDFEGLKVSLTR